MKSLELSFASVNSANYSKTVTVNILIPDSLNSDTGAMLFTHGWGGNRFQHLDKMEYSCDKYNMLCLATEYRMSGFDFDLINGRGSYRPYDASFLQVFDVLNSLREALQLFPQIDRHKIFHYGGSQGGQIAFLSTIFAPNTFAAVYSSSGMTWLSPNLRVQCGREFTDYELSVRSVIEHAANIKCPIFMEHGDADETVYYEEHAVALQNKLKEEEKIYTMKLYPGGSHSLQPTITKMDAFEYMIPKVMKVEKNPRIDDFRQKSKVEINCAGRKLSIDWGEASDSMQLFTWD